MYKRQRPYHKFYNADHEKVEVYLTKNDTSLIEKLWRKKFIRINIPIIDKRIKWLNKSIALHVDFEPERCFESAFDVRKIPESIISSLSKCVAAYEYKKSDVIDNWFREPTNYNPLYPEGLIHTTLDGRKAVSYTHLDVYKRQV